MKSKFPAKPLKCKHKNLTLSIKRDKIAEHDSLLIAKKISQGLDVFSFCFGKDNTVESLPFKGFSNFEIQKAGQLLKKRMYEINAENNNSSNSNPFCCTNVKKLSSTKLPNKSMSKTNNKTSNDFKSSDGILRKARLNIASDYKVHDGLFSPYESWLLKNRYGTTKNIQNESKTEKEDLSFFPLLKSKKNISNKSCDTNANSCKPHLLESRIKPEVHNAKGPRIKHVCRSASVVLKLPAATLDDHYDQLSSASLETLEGDIGSRKSSTKIKECSESSDICEPSDTSSKEDCVEEPRDHILPKSLPHEACSTPLEKSTTKKLQDYWKDPDLHSRDHMISIDYWQNYDPDEVCETGFALVGSQPAFPSAICFLCGSAGFEQCQLLHCLICCEPYHEYCLNSILGTTASSVRDWLCPSCVQCEVCAKYGTSLGQISCRQCFTCYHAECMSGEAQHQMFNCIKCKRWIHTDCNKMLYKEREEPPNFLERRICQFCYTEDNPTPSEHEKEIIVNSLNILNSLKTNKKLFELLKWNKSTSTASDLRKIRKKLNSVAKSKSLNGADADLTLGQELTYPQDSNADLILSDLIIDVIDDINVKAIKFTNKKSSLDTSNELEFKENNSFCNNRFNGKGSIDFESPPTSVGDYKTSKNLLSIKEKIDNYEYRSFLDLHNDILNVLYSIDCMDLLELYSDIVQEILSWLGNNVHSETDRLINQDLFNETNIIFDAIKQRNKLKQNNLNNKTQRSGNPKDENPEDSGNMNRKSPKNENCKYILSIDSEDDRHCVLCKKKGEGMDSLEGRLLYCGQNEWVHCNCALWSSEVFEEVDGSLQNIHSAIKRSKFIQCIYCNKKGATVGCCSKTCFNTYHFVCAKKSQCYFLESKMIYCNMHDEELEKTSYKLDDNLFVNRPMYVEQNFKRKKHLPADSIKLMIGAFKIHSFGKNILDVCNDGDLIVPEDFHCSRLFWSTNEPSKMVEYDIKTKSQYFLMDSEDQGVNITLSHGSVPWYDDTVKDVITVMVDQICTKEDTDDNQLLTPEVKDAIFKDLHHEFVDGLFMNDFLLRYDDILNDPVEDNAAILHVKIHEESRRDKDWTKKFLQPSMGILQVDGMNDSDEDEMESSEEPVTCVRCHRTYRTTSSYQNHLIDCTVNEYLLSSESEGEDDGEDLNYPTFVQKVEQNMIQPQFVDSIIQQSTSLINTVSDSNKPIVWNNSIMQEQLPSHYVMESIQHVPATNQSYMEPFGNGQVILQNQLLKKDVIDDTQTFIVNDTEDSHFNVDLDIAKDGPHFSYQPNATAPTLMLQPSQVPQLSYIQAPQTQYITIASPSYTIQPTVVMQPNIVPQYITYQPTYSMVNAPQTYIVVNNVPSVINAAQPQIIINNESNVATKQIQTYQKTRTKHYFKKTSSNEQMNCVKIVKSTTQKTMIHTEKSSTPRSFAENSLPVSSSSPIQQWQKTISTTQTLQHKPAVYLDYPRTSLSNSVQTQDKATCIRVDSALQNRLLYSKLPKTKIIQYKKMKILPKSAQKIANAQSSSVKSERKESSLKAKVCNNILGYSNKLASSMCKLQSVDINSIPKISQINIDSKLPDFPLLPKKIETVTKLVSPYQPQINSSLSKNETNKKCKEFSAVNLKKEKMKVYSPPCKKLKSVSTVLQKMSPELKNTPPKSLQVYSNKSDKERARNKKKCNSLYSYQSSDMCSSNVNGQFNHMPNVYSADNITLDMSSLSYLPSIDTKQPSPVLPTYCNNDLSKQNLLENYKENIVVYNSNPEVDDQYSFKSDKAEATKMNGNRTSEYEFSENSDKIIDQLDQNKEEKNIKEIHFSCLSYLEEFEKQIKDDLERYNQIDCDNSTNETEELVLGQVEENQLLPTESNEKPCSSTLLLCDARELENTILPENETELCSPVRTQIISPSQENNSYRKEIKPQVLKPNESSKQLSGDKRIEKKGEDSKKIDHHLDIEEKENITCNLQKIPLQSSPPPSKSTTQRMVFEMKSSDGSFICQSTDFDEVWQKAFDAVQASRLEKQLPPLPLSTLKKLKSLGKENKTVKHIFGQFSSGYFMNNEAESVKKEPSTLIRENSRCARTEIWKYSKRKYDMFAWLCSSHRTPPRLLHAAPDNSELYASRRSTANLPLTTRYRNLCSLAKETLTVFRSSIHGRGLFCLCDIEAGEMVIEYTGEVIRATVSDKREKEYLAKGIGCYMFKIDDSFVIDATMTGNAARFINHSCDPNCYSKVVDILGKSHIIIFTLRKIHKGEELTYDYKFPIEDDNKISCHCSALRCRRFLN